MAARTSIRKIAARLGVHYSTVSRALRDDPLISGPTRARIAEAAKAMGYRRDAMLSALASYRHKAGYRFGGTIGLVVLYHQAAAHTYFYRLEKGARACAKELGFAFETFFFNDDGRRPHRIQAILRARGIQGILIAPTIAAQSEFPHLDWDEFCTVAFNYTITNIEPYRACIDVVQNTHLQLRSLRGLGYRRIGLCLEEGQVTRSKAGTLGIVLAEQFRQPADCHITPLCLSRQELTPARFAAWIRRERPDCILGGQPYIYEWLRDGGWQMPRDLGFSLIEWNADYPYLAGLDSRWEHLGRCGMDLLAELLRDNVRGLPPNPRHSLVNGVWNPGTTVAARRPAR